MFLPFEHFPWFQEASIKKILHVEMPSNNHLYLVALQRYHALVDENPEEWMPWNYADTLAGLGLAG